MNKFDRNPGWSSRAHYLIDFDMFSLRIDHIQSEASLGQDREDRFFNFFNFLICLIDSIIIFINIPLDVFKKLKKRSTFWSFFGFNFYWFLLLLIVILNLETFSENRSNARICYKNNENVKKTKLENHEIVDRFFNLFNKSNGIWMKMIKWSIQTTKQIKKNEKNDPPYPGPGWLQTEYDQFLMKNIKFCINLAWSYRDHYLIDS